MEKKKLNKGEIACIVIIVLIIVGLLVRNMELQFRMKNVTCRTNVQIMNAATSLSYAQHLVNYRRAVYPAVMTGNLFAEGIVPSCPFKVDYLYTSTNGEVTSHNHVPWRKWRKWRNLYE